MRLLALSLVILAFPNVTLAYNDALFSSLEVTQDGRLRSTRASRTRSRRIHDKLPKQDNESANSKDGTAEQPERDVEATKIDDGGRADQPEDDAEAAKSDDGSPADQNDGEGEDIGAGDAAVQPTHAQKANETGGKRGRSVEDVARRRQKSVDALAKAVRRKKKRGKRIQALCKTLITVFLGTLVSMLVFTVFLRPYFPLVYSHNELQGSTPHRCEDFRFGWIGSSFGINPHDGDTWKQIGSDCAFYLSFCDLALRFIIITSIPALIVRGTWWYYGRSSLRATSAHVSSFEYVWIAQIWFTVFYGHYVIKRAAIELDEHRIEWIFMQKPPQSHAIIVQGIPPELRSDERLYDYVSKLFPRDVVVDTYVVRRISHLMKLACKLEVIDHQLDELDFQLEHCESNDIDSSKIQNEIDKALVDRKGMVERLTFEQQTVENQVAENDPSVFGPSAFVTFSTSIAADVARQVRWKDGEDIMVVSAPPSVTDVNYTHLMMTAEDITLWTYFGYAVCVLIFLASYPVAALIESLAHPRHIRSVLRSLGVSTFLSKDQESSSEGIVAPFLLSQYLGLVPSFFGYVLRNYTQSVSQSWDQIRMQQVFFYFLLFYVAGVTLLGEQTVDILLNLPIAGQSIFTSLVDCMSDSANFFRSLILMASLEPIFGMTRISNFFWYCYYRRRVPDSRAKTLSEPEDINYYGMGTRSAFASFYLFVAVAFSSVMPGVTLFAIPYFVFCRLCTGYSLVFAETRKPDQGGHYFFQQLVHFHDSITAFACVSALLVHEVDKGVRLYGKDIYVATWASFLALPFLWQSRKALLYIDWANIPHELAVERDKGSDPYSFDGGNSNNDVYSRKATVPQRYVQPELVEKPIARGRASSASAEC